MNARTFAGGRNTKYAYSRNISRGTLESTFELDSTEPVVEFEWGYAVASTTFPGRYYTVRKVGDLWCSSCRDERIRPQHIQAVLDFIAAKEQEAMKAVEPVSRPAPEVQVVTITITYTQAAVIRCVARKDIPEYGLTEGQCFYWARSSKNDGTYYLLTWNYARRTWTCGCPATKQCCRHVVAVVADCKRAHVIHSYKPAPVASVIAEAVEVVKASDEAVKDVRRGYLTRKPEVKRDEKYGVILR